MEFQLQINIKAGKVTFYQFLFVIVHGLSVIQDFKFILLKVFTCIRYDLYNGISWSRWINGRIFKFKRALKQRNMILPIFVCYIWVCNLPIFCVIVVEGDGEELSRWPTDCAHTFVKLIKLILAANKIYQFLEHRLNWSTTLELPLVVEFALRTFSGMLREK